MHCNGCGRENREGRKFCGGCGAPLAAPCDACGAANEPDESFCGNCGVALARVQQPAFLARGRRRDSFLLRKEGQEVARQSRD